MSVFLDLDPDAWVASNELAFAIRDGFPVTPGHTLVVPRRVISDWWQAPPDLRLAMLELVDDVKRRLDVEFAPNGYNVGFNAGAAAGQTVEHFHVHVIPRFDGDVPDPRGGVRHVIPERGNYLDPSASPASASPRLITQLEGHLRAELLRCLDREEFDRIDLLVSFVMQSGLNLIKGRLDDALARGAHVRLLTTDYLQVTDSTALGFFLDRLDSDGAGRLEARVFSDPSTSFHPKAYIFASSSSDSGVAFVGSSNLSYSGISAGVEWNIETREIGTLADRFERLWTDDRSLPLTGDWLAAYEQSRAARRLALKEGGVNVADEDSAAIGQSEVEAATPVKPWSVQVEALSALTATRLDGHSAGLVVMATGLGKTWLAAFDSTRPEFRRVLFVAHRDEILKQARDVYRQIRPGGRFTLFTGEERDASGDVVFASVQSLHRNLAHLDANDFDYVIVDEFHHAAAHSYRKVIAHFQPDFLLGLTATPSRADNADLLSLCNDNLVYDCGLVEGVNRQLLSPFRYRAIPDVADYEHIPWRSGRFDAEELTAQIATQERAQQVFDEWYALGGSSRRALGFCCTIAHADFMADFFRRNGVAAVAVHSGGSSSPRADSIDRLEDGSLSVLFTVDLFNEGLDVPAIDLVMMLRPTESGVVFLQQLGRGLRRSENKQVLEIIDLVGNHRGFLLKARLLADLAGYRNLTDREAVKLLSGDEGIIGAWTTDLPEGCSIIIEPEVVDLLQELVGPASSGDRLVELARQWVDEHEGRRPSALELTMVSGQPFSLKQQGGWFGLMRRLGLLSSDEERVVDLAAKFLLSIEHGSYTKSYKLITLLGSIQLDKLRSGVPVSELARMSRWMIFRDSDLVADVSDASSAFADATQPTVAEWELYWRKNPINAYTTNNKQTPAWFSLVDDQFTLNLDVPNDLGSTFDAMVEEVTEYRLHRYLVGQKARRVGETRRPIREGAEIDATFVVETTGGVPTSVVIESGGGSAGGKFGRNLDYVAGFDAVLERLRLIGAQLADAYIDTRSTANLSIADRRLDPGSDFRYPVDLSAVSDLENVRRSLLRSMSKAGRGPGMKGGGNSRKRTRLVVAIDDVWTAVQLADALASGDIPMRTRSAGDRDTAG
jgi:superfamily II DNA or RNA helicase/diadenosine tetraphosphate (Ap4A) HIT family hydrolase/HKD family nuclease